MSTNKELESIRNVFEISEKTSAARLKEFSKGNWQSYATKQVAGDMVNNVKDLLVGTNIDWESVLKSIHYQHLNSLKFGVDAIAVHGARYIGGLVAKGNWSMDDPPAVYLSVKYFADIVSDKFEDLKTKMLETAVTYGQKSLPDADSYMEILDFLLEVKNKEGYRAILNRLVPLLTSENIEEAYKIVKSDGDLVRRRQGFSNTTTSSILIPPKPGI